eukprot:SAG31_NODE_1109_length_9860_cov_22.119353_6_plen_69_part_00
MKEFLDRACEAYYEGSPIINSLMVMVTLVAAMVAGLAARQEWGTPQGHQESTCQACMGSGVGGPSHAH